MLTFSYTDEHRESGHRYERVSIHKQNEEGTGYAYKDSRSQIDTIVVPEVDMMGVVGSYYRIS